MSPDCISSAVQRVLLVNPSSLADRLHRWRLLGLTREYGENNVLRTEMNQIFSYKAFRFEFPESPDLIFPFASGWRVRQRVRSRAKGAFETEYHVDQLLATCAEVSVPIEQAIDTAKGGTTLENLLRTSRLDFVGDQETAWSMVAFCGYLPSENRWEDRFGEIHSYDHVAERIADQALGSGLCDGTHNPYALGWLLEADRHYAVLTPPTRSKVQRFLLECSKALNRSQLANGAWSASWARNADDTSPHTATTDSVYRLIQVTGHHLEWILISPQDLRPSPMALEAACRFLSKAIPMQSSEVILNNYCAFSHGARALLLASKATRSAGN